MSIVTNYRLEPMIGDPDDHRPATRWALLADPGDDAGRVDHLAVIVEWIGPGERIPLHVHDVDEVILPHGPGRFRLGGSATAVDEGAVVFIPAGVAHGLANPAESPLALHAVFPSTRVWLRYIERNPAPGSEADPIGPGATYDLRTGAVDVDRS